MMSHADLDRAKYMIVSTGGIYIERHVVEEDVQDT